MKVKIITIIIILFISVPAFAVDFIVGAKAGYFTWVPYMRELDRIPEIDKGSGVLYGPVLSLLFTPDISFSMAGLIGKQSTYWSTENESIVWFSGGPSILNGTYYVEIKRRDIDSALSYRISNNIKLFAGYKYQHIITNLRASIRSEAFSNGEILISEGDIEIELPAHGPAAGIGYSIPLDGGYFFASNLSVIYLWSRFDLAKNKWDVYEVTGSNQLDNTGRGGNMLLSYKTKQMGLNFEPTFGVKVGNRAVYTLGLRIQWMMTKFVDDPVIRGTSGKEEKIGPDSWMDDYIYGMYVSALYIF